MTKYHTLRDWIFVLHRNYEKSAAIFKQGANFFLLLQLIFNQFEIPFRARFHFSDRFDWTWAAAAATAAAANAAAAASAAVVAVVANAAY